MVAPRPVSLRVPIVGSVVLHGMFAAALIFSRTSAPTPAPRMYKVNLIAAPPGIRQVGVVQPNVVAPAVATPAPKAASKPAVEKIKAPVKSVPAPAPQLATPNVVVAPKVTTPAPVAGGGPEGGKGADVANVKPDGIEFPFPAYLERVVRQIALQFKPSARGALQAEVSFLIRRDGSVAGLRITKRSGVYSFDQDALAAVELASRSFGALPQGFTDDVLPVIFSFDPRLIR